MRHKSSLSDVVKLKRLSLSLEKSDHAFFETFIAIIGGALNDGVQMGVRIQNITRWI